MENATSKLKTKKLDLLVANDISAVDTGFGVDENRVTLLFPDGKVESLPLMNKSEVAEILIAHIKELLERK
jgi:phosphopantothenoylcysteine decarboxylase/phosphopantothenate--cysteine ligase